MTRHDPTNHSVSRVTQVALFVIIGVCVAIIGVMMVLMVTINSGANGFSTLWTQVMSLRTLVFLVLIVGFGVLSYLSAGALSRRAKFEFGQKLVFIFGLWSVGIVVVAFAVWGIRAISILHLIWGILVPAGMVLITVGLTRRIGSSKHCAACGYAHEDESGNCCPECGALWNQRSGTVVGERKRSIPMVCTGSVLIVLCIVLILRPFYSGALAPLMPTNLLIADVTSGLNDPYALSRNSWQELMTRTLTKEQHQSLFAGLLNRRTTDWSLGPGEAGWLEQQVLTEQVSPELLNRFYDEMLEFRLEGPTNTPIHQDAHWRVLATSRVTPFGGMDVRIAFVGFSVNGEFINATRVEHFQTIHNYSDLGSSFDLVTPTIQVRPDSLGTLSISAELIVLHAPRAVLTYGPAWDEKGDILIPTGPGHVRHVTLEREVIVTPRD